MADGMDLDFRICFTFNNAEFMRELKFRAWDTESNKMVYDPYFFDVYHFSDENRVNQKTYRYYEDWRALEDGRGWECELMQFTGLKDKNGKEIYEGDLLKFFDKVIAVVVFQDLGGWSYKWIDETYIRVRQRNPEPFFHNITLWEVAGNIYQDKHLLE